METLHMKLITDQKEEESGNSSDDPSNPEKDALNFGRAKPAQGSYRALLVLVIIVYLISLVALLLTLLMLFGKVGNRCGCSAKSANEAAYSVPAKSLQMDLAKIKALEENMTSLQLGLMAHLDSAYTELKTHLDETNSDLAELNKTQIKMAHLDSAYTELKTHLNRTNNDLAELNKTQIKTDAGYNALRDDLNMTRNELLMMSDTVTKDTLAAINTTLPLRMAHLDSAYTELKTRLNRMNNDLAELNKTQIKTDAGYNSLRDDLNMTRNELMMSDMVTKDTLATLNTTLALRERVIYYQTMTPYWIKTNACYINSNRSFTTEQLTFNAGPEGNALLLKVPMIPADVLPDSTPLTVKIVVSNDVTIGNTRDSDPKYGVSDGISFVGFETVDAANYKIHNYSPCFGFEGISGTNLIGKRVSSPRPRPKDSIYPGQFVMILKLNERWGLCYTAQDGGLVKTAVYSKRLILSKGLTLEVYKHSKDERIGIKFIEVTIIQDT